MTVYLLDTNTCVHYLRKRHAHVIRRIRARPRRQVCLCAIVVGELYYGAYKGSSAFRAANLALLARFCPQFNCLPFDKTSADVFGELRAYLESLGTPIGPYDMQIAAIALANRLTLVTHNVAEFSRVPGLTVEDWEVP